MEKKADKWIKIKESELKVLLRMSRENIRTRISYDNDGIIDASHILKINESKIKLDKIK